MKFTTLSIAGFMAAMTLSLGACKGSSKSASEVVDDSISLDSTEIGYEELDVIDVVEEDSVEVPQADASVSSDDASSAQSVIERLKSSTSAAQAKAIAQEAKAYVQKLMASGKVQEAKAYIAKVGPYIKEKVPEVYESMSSSVSEETKEKLKDAASDIKEKASETKEKVSDAASQAKEALKNRFSKD